MTDEAHEKALEEQRKKDDEHDAELKRQREKDDTHDAELERQRKKDDDHDRILKELSERVSRLEHCSAPMWLKASIIVSLLLSTAALVVAFTR